MIIQFHQTVSVENDNGTNMRVAEGVVTCYAVDSRTNRPTTKLPGYVKEILGLS
jgi:hypothetical protein